MQSAATPAPPPAGSAADGAVGEQLLSTLLHASHLLAPDALAPLLQRHAGLLGASITVLYLVDLKQEVLVPLPGKGLPERATLSVDGSLAGRCYRYVEILEGEGERDGQRRLWIPVLDGAERLGVLSLDVDEVNETLVDQARGFASLVAELVMTTQLCGDLVTQIRRREPMGLAAEMQWQLLPPLTFSTDRVAISGVMEPCYTVGGDAFDYALNGDVMHVAVLDAMGHGVEASLLTSVALGGYRNSRRSGGDLAANVLAADTAVGNQFGGERFVTGLFGRLDVMTGRLAWVNVGHPTPLLLRRGRVVKRLESEPVLPLGLGDTVTDIAEESLEPGDRLLLVTDGVTEARSPEGEFFGEERLVEFVYREASSGHSAPETMRRMSKAILEHQSGLLQDDATTLFVEWLGGNPDQLQP